MSDQLAMLTISGRVLCDVVLDAGRGNTQLALCLDEACLYVHSLISKGVHRGTHIALMSVNSHYSGVNFEVVR